MFKFDLLIAWLAPKRAVMGVKLLTTESRGRLNFHNKHQKQSPKGKKHLCSLENLLEMADPKYATLPGIVSLNSKKNKYIEMFSFCNNPTYFRPLTSLIFMKPVSCQKQTSIMILR